MERDINFGVSRAKQKIALALAFVLAGCALSRKVPYQYQFGGKVYKSTMQGGLIVDTSFVYAADSSIEKALAWTRNGDRIRHKVLSPKDTAYRSSDEGARTAEGVERVINGSRKEWKSIYDRYLKARPGFGGRIGIRISVRPDGTVEDVFVLEDTTDYPEFSQAIIDVCSTWSFEKSGGSATDWINFPVSFSE